MNNLINLYNNHTGKISDRWFAYINQYDKIFKPFRDLPVKLLEIGVQNGGSLEIWNQYFPNAIHIVGCDINPKCQELSYDDPKIKVVVGDISTNETTLKIKEITDKWDIVIDDGSHHSRHIIDAFTRFFPKISDGGMFIAEDLHCSYWQEFEGGLADPFSSISFFKRLADIINFEHWGIALERAKYLSSFQIHYNCTINEKSLEQIHSVEFLNSQCIIRKQIAKENFLGTRLIAGLHEQVTKDWPKMHNTKLKASDQSDNPWSDISLFNVSDTDKYAMRFTLSEIRASNAYERAEALLKRLTELEWNSKELNDALEERDSRIKAFEDMSNNAAQEIEELSRTLEGRDCRIKIFEDMSNNAAQEIEELKAHIKKLIKLINLRDHQIAESFEKTCLLIQSNSWRMTAPLRKITFLLRKLWR